MMQRWAAEPVHCTGGGDSIYKLKADEEGELIGYADAQAEIERLTEALHGKDCAIAEISSDCERKEAENKALREFVEMIAVKPYLTNFPSADLATHSVKARRLLDNKGGEW